MSPARRIAFHILERVHAGAWASELLLAHTKDLDSRDAGLTYELVLGCLRRQLQLDYVISLYAPKRLDIEVRIALRLGVYQLRHLDRIPAHAAVSESVELAKAAGKRSAGGLVNAVLRRVPREPVEWPDRPTALSCPAWLLESWDAQFGAAASTRIAEAFLEPAETSVASTGRIQDPGAQSIVPLLGIEPGMTFLDVCAAPGNKTAQAIEAGASAVACDIHPHRLRAVGDLDCRRVVLDASAPLPFAAKFDRVLVDAPCSGTGTLGRNPEIKWRLQPSHLLDLQRTQVQILRNALNALKHGGVLVYSTCSLQREENEEVVTAVLAGGTAARTYHRLPGIDPGDGFYAAVLPFG